MKYKSLEQEDNCCDFCGRRCERERLFFICAGHPGTVDWKEIICEECEAPNSDLGLVVTPLSSLLAS